MENTIINKVQKWDDLPAKEKSQILMAAFLILSAVVLVFTCFFMTLQVGASILGASGEFLATAMALLGLTLIVKNSLIDIQTQIQEKLGNDKA